MFEMPKMMEIWILAGLGVMVILFLMGMMARLYRKAGPHEALIVYGFRGPRIITAKGTVIVPMVENYHDLSLELMSLKMPEVAAGRKVWW